MIDSDSGRSCACACSGHSVLSRSLRPARPVVCIHVVSRTRRSTVPVHDNVPLRLEFPGSITSSGATVLIHRVRPDLAGRCSRRRRRSAERRSIQATIWPATAAPSALAPSTTSTASSSCAAIATTGSLPAGALERGSSPTTKSARSSAGSSEAGLSGGSRCQIELGWGAPACASRASGLAGPDGVRAGACAPAHFARM